MRKFNIEVESGVAVLATWADQGEKGRKAGEMFNIVTRDLEKAWRTSREESDKYKISVFENVLKERIKPNTAIDSLNAYIRDYMMMKGGV